MVMAQDRVGSRCWVVVLACAACGGSAKPAGQPPAGTLATAAGGSAAQAAPASSATGSGGAAPAASGASADGPASLAGIRDEGQFAFYLRETAIATIEY